MIEKICPKGFVLPEHPDNPRVQYVDLSLSECAFSCVSHPRYTSEEYAWLFNIRFWSCCFSGLLALVAISLWCMEADKLNHNFFVIVYGVNLIVAGFVLTLVYIPDREKRFCEDNATPAYDHPSVACSIEGFWITFCFGVMCVCWCCQSYVLYDRIVLGPKLSGHSFSYVGYIFNYLSLLACLYSAHWFF